MSGRALAHAAMIYFPALNSFVTTADADAAAFVFSDRATSSSSSSSSYSYANSHRSRAAPLSLGVQRFFVASQWTWAFAGSWHVYPQFEILYYRGLNPKHHFSHSTSFVIRGRLIDPPDICSLYLLTLSRILAWRLLTSAQNALYLSRVFHIESRSSSVVYRRCFMEFCSNTVKGVTIKKKITASAW